ncbi:MAG: ABC transporter permease [Anaerolineae bacterium]|nr:ABC transporter permease [Anaerolineae bacterium]
MSKYRTSDVKAPRLNPEAQAQAVALEEQRAARSYGARFEDLRRTLHRLRRSTLSLVGLAIVLGLIVLAIFAPQIAPYPEDIATVHFERTFQPPGRQYLFGTDEVGRDVLSRVIFGTRISLSIGVAVLAIALAIGVPLGLIAGYVGGPVNTIIMRLTDIFLAIPPVVLAMAVSAVLTPTLENSIFAIAFSWWPWYTRLIQGQVLSIKEETFVEASRSAGANPLYITFKEILPNVLTILIVKVTLDIGYAVLTGAVLGFLGLGVRPPTPEWGTMASKGRLHLPTRWWLTTFPGLAIFVTVLGFNLLGDGLRDAFDVELE